MNIFEDGTRRKLKFFHKGIASIEDLWDLKVECLDVMYRKNRKELNELNEESLLNRKSSKVKEIELKCAILKRIVEVKLEEKEARENEAQRKAMKERYAKKIEEKQDQSLDGLSLEELKKKHAEL